MEVSVKRENTIVISERDAKIVELLANGKRSKQVADSLGMKLRSLDHIINRLRIELGCQTTSHLVATFLRKKIIE